MKSQFREMKMLVFYDLPTKSKNDRSIANKFRRDLEKLGFIMIQESVYLKHCLNFDWVRRTKVKLYQIMPSGDCDIRLLAITNKQYQNIEIIRGEKSFQELYIEGKGIIRL